MIFKTTEELREIWESENFGEDDKLFDLAFDRHDIYFSIYDTIKDMGKPKTHDELLKQYSDFMKDLISASETEIKKFDKNKSHKYDLFLDSSFYNCEPCLVIYQKKDFEDFVSSYEDYKQQFLKKEEEDKKKMKKKREKDYELYLKLKEEFEHEDC